MISEIKTITRFLASVDALNIEVGSKEDDASEYYKTQYVYPVRDTFDTAKDFCLMVKLVQCSKNNLILSDSGKLYLYLSDKRDKAYILEPNQKQREFLCNKIFLVSDMLDLVRKMLYTFNRGEDGEIYLSIIEAAAVKDQNFLGLMFQSEILIEKKEIIILSPKYSDRLELEVASSVKVITPTAFEESEKKKLEISKIAEEFVMQSENKRLRRAAALEQSKKISYVALKNVAAGYDIASFNNKDSQGYDRFIEVKAGKLKPISFFLSRNELETARRLKGLYYIYYVCMKDKKPQELYIFQNPIEGIMKDPEFIIHIDTYEISEK